MVKTSHSKQIRVSFADSYSAHDGNVHGQCPALPPTQEVQDRKKKDKMIGREEEKKKDRRQLVSFACQHSLR
jgi:hypothetical protein